MCLSCSHLFNIRTRSVPNLKDGVPLEISDTCVHHAPTELWNLKTGTTPKRQIVTHYTATHPNPHIPSVYWKIINTSVFTIGYTILKRLF